MTGYAGPDTGWAHSAMPSGRWCYTFPWSSTNNFAVTLSAIVYQPLWTGVNTRLRGVMATFPNVADTAGNVFRFALYTDRGDMWPSALVTELPGDIPTTTTVANQAKVLDCDVAVSKLSPMWIAALCIGGTAPTTYATYGGHPYVSPNAGSSLAAGVYQLGVSAFPAAPPGTMSYTQVPTRLLVKLTA